MNMKTFLIVVVFASILSAAIYLDSLAIHWIISLFGKISRTWDITFKVALWTLFSFFTGGPAFAIAFILSGAIKTKLDD